MQSKIILFRTIEPMLRFMHTAAMKNGKNSRTQVVIDAAKMDDWFDVQAQIWHDLDFPDQITVHAQSIRHISWDAFLDWLSDLSWLNQGIEENTASESYQPIALVIIHPSVLFEQSPIQFALFIDICFHAMVRHEVQGRDFTVILGPVEANRQLGPFLMTLQAQERYLLLE